MSSALALGAVSAVLRNLLDNGLIDVSSVLGPVTVSAVAPDRIDTDAPNAAPQINLFLHQVLPNAAWSNRQLPTRSSLGELKYWVDWLALAGVAGGFALLAAALLLPLTAFLKRQGI